MKSIPRILLFMILLNICKSCDIEKLYTFEVPNIYPQCRKDFDYFINGLRSNKIWAVESKWSCTWILNSWIKVSFKFVLLSQTLVILLTHMEICLTLVISTNVWVQTLERIINIDKNTAWCSSNQPQMILSFRCFQVNLIFYFIGSDDMSSFVNKLETV